MNISAVTANLDITEPVANLALLVSSEDLKFKVRFFIFLTLTNFIKIIFLDSTCQPCNCSGNINPQDPESCDSVDGTCLKCLNNTFGEACSLCAPFFFGDAVLLKDCRQCNCKSCGTHSCESYTGQCICKDNVIGEDCNRCAPNHYGFNKCKGCFPCGCQKASIGSSCDLETGQCQCQPGVTDKTCNNCAPGFWNYTESGCQCEPRNYP